MAAKQAAGIVQRVEAHIDRDRQVISILADYEGMCRQSVEGAIYRNELLAADKEGRICRVPYDVSEPVDTFWDLGFSDTGASIGPRGPV